MKHLNHILLTSLLALTVFGIPAVFADRDDDKRGSQDKRSDRSDHRSEEKPKQDRGSNQQRQDDQSKQFQSSQRVQQRSDQDNRSRQIQTIQPNQNRANSEDLSRRARSVQIMQQRRDRDNQDRQARSAQVPQQNFGQDNRFKQDSSAQSMQLRRDQDNRFKQDLPSQVRQQRFDQNRSSFGQDRSSLIQKRRDFDERIKQDQRRNDLTREINRLPSQDRDSLRKQAELFRRERGVKERSPDYDKRAKEIRDSYTKRRVNDKRESNEVSGSVRTHYSNYNKWFTPSFYNNRRHFHGHYWRDDVNWWWGAPWNRVYSWLGWAGAAGIVYPIYYSDGYPVQFDSGWTDYYSDNSYPQMIQGSWLPLGVYALGPTVNEAANSDMFVQLAVNRSGEISGTYYNAATDQSYPVIGFVDRDTQEAYWQIPGENFAPEMATGMFNLTQDVAEVELTFSNRVIQNWALVRISE